ncbi:peptidyl-prolyl cis-trans isomerase [Starkeya sp. ORNL1]|uniref:peptidylprolyl isomerase n=1 Tax=Starkeya sp. ORNL1 TaxID=2709380 RepID=UPI001463A2D6|nr:peptidylprolyl isomerase [Starkeya sp. ORNL1]QJP16346.1 peptidyl-prolyl cis-trans isomerase [Starkeya sp. ORNL1]
MTTSGGEPAVDTVDVDGAKSQGGGRLNPVWRLLREPLLQFMLIGAVIFAVHAAVTPSVSKERLIEVTPEVRQSIIDTFKSAHEQREPAPDELAPLIDLWILNEITFREALAQGLDKGDEMIRDRITHKMRLLIFGGVDVKEPTPQELQEWYEKRRIQYDIPDLVSFIEVPFTGADAETQSRAVLQEILSGTEPEDVRMRAHIFGERPRHTLMPSFGQNFVDALVALPIGQWQTLQASDGWHIVRLDTFVPGRKVDLSEVSAQAVQTWKDERRRILAIAATRDLGKAYVIRRGEP